jgi:hypothetical protein
MKKSFFVSIIFLVFAVCKAQDKPIVFLPPDNSFYNILYSIDCSSGIIDKGKIDSVVKDYITTVKIKDSSTINPVSFRLLETLVWKNLTMQKCVEENIANAKIKAIAEEVKNIPSEAVLAFLTRFEFTPAFPIDKSILSTQEEILSFFKNATDEFLLSARNELLSTHVEVLLLVAKTLKKAEACPLIKEAEDFSKYLAFPEAFQKDITDLKVAVKCN